MSYLSKKDILIGAMMALTTVGLVSSCCAIAALGMRRAQAQTTTKIVVSHPAPMSGALGLGSLCGGAFCLSLTRRMLRGD